MGHTIKQLCSPEDSWMPMLADSLSDILFYLEIHPIVPLDLCFPLFSIMKLFNEIPYFYTTNNLEYSTATFEHHTLSMWSEEHWPLCEYCVL